MCKTIKAHLGCFKIIRNCLTLNCAFIFINSMIFSHISYGLTTWSQAHQTTIKHIECLYNQAIKILDKKRIRHHHCQILKKYKILSFANFISLHTVKLVFKCLNNTAPRLLCESVTRLQSGTRSTTRATSKGNCIVPFRRTSFAQTAFSIKGTKLWNSLPDTLKSIATLLTFKKQTKQWLIQQQSCSHI